MQYTKKDKGYIVRFELGENFMKEMQQFCVDHNIKAAEFRAIGAAREAQLGYYHLDTKEYEFHTLSDPVEVVSLTGNVALVDDAPFLHVHAVLSDTKLQCFGGHINKLVVGPTLEVFVDVHDVSIVREYEDAIGLKLCTFPLV